MLQVAVTMHPGGDARDYVVESYIRDRGPKMEIFRFSKLKINVKPIKAQSQKFKTALN